MDSRFRGNDVKKAHFSREPTMIRLILGIGLGAVTMTACAESPYVELKGHRYTIEIAADDASRAHGLMNRTEMAADHGMLFVFDDDMPRAFWMKNTKIPLDMLFFDGDNKLVSIQHDVPPCVSDPCPPYSSGAPARYVLELNAGESAKLGLTSGDPIAIHR
jgi:uncharacterized membrane protein (UPF0127 family)